MTYAEGHGKGGLGYNMRIVIYNKIQFTDPLTLQLAPLFNPRPQRWNDEFDWSNDDLAILGTTSSGRATVALLQLNRTSNINLRGLLKSAGLHPPLT